MATLEIFQFLCHSDNYGVLLHDPGSGATAAIDAPDAGAVKKAAAKKGWKLSHILITHHHADHTQGVPELVQEFGCLVVGPAAEGTKLAGLLDVVLEDGDTFEFAGHTAQVFVTPGHTLGHLCWWFEDQNLLFAGDTLFPLGCGRVFEGTAEQMWGSLDKIRQLPLQTRVFCGHEYTAANAKFALSVEPNNEALQVRSEAIIKLRADDKPTVPTTIALERQTNPFLRPESAEIQANIGLTGAGPVEVFAEIRRRKDSF